MNRSDLTVAEQYKIIPNGSAKNVIWLIIKDYVLSSVQFSRSVVSDSLRPHESILFTVKSLLLRQVLRICSMLSNTLLNRLVNNLSEKFICKQ